MTFLLLNRAAYRGYFQDDDLDTLGWARALPASEFLKYLVTPRLSPTNFRPVGAFYYHALETGFGLELAKIEAAVVIVWAYVQEIAAGGVSEQERACLLDEMESVEDIMPLSREERTAVYSKIEVLGAQARSTGA